jgi:hypothetical protein
MVEQERDKAAGKARIARDTLNAGGIVLQERERKALEEQALADVVVTEGIGWETQRTPLDECGCTKGVKRLK